MARVWKATRYPGVRFREHEGRRHGNAPDRYFTVRYKIDGILKEEGLGWASEGWTVEKAALERSSLREAHRTGKGDNTLEERRSRLRTEREAQLERQEQEKKLNVTFREMADQWIAYAKRNKKTWEWDDRRLRLHVLPLLGELPMKTITPAHLEQLKVQSQEREHAPATTNHCLQLVRAIFNHAERLELYQGANPARRVKLIRHDNKRVRFLSHQEAELLLATIQKKSQDWHDICLVSLFAGLRFGEIAALVWGDIDLENQLIHVMDAKSGEGRKAFLTSSLLEMFKRRAAEPDPETDLVFPGRYGQIILKVSRTFDRTIEQLGWNVGISDARQRVTFHSLRHTFASWLALQGEPILTIKELLGHKTIEMTLRYSHLTPDTKKAAVVRLDERANGKVVEMQEWRSKA